MNAAVAAVWTAYADHHPRAVLTGEREALIKRRLEHYKAEMLIDAIDGNHLDRFCNGDNDSGRSYHDLKLILRDGDHIERYAMIAEEKRLARDRPQTEAELRGFGRV